MVTKRTKKQKHYDVIIVGGGISGLYCAYNILQKNKKTSILILESSNRLGGRIYTVGVGKNMKYEAGAARFSNKHKLFYKLLKELKLDKDKIPISNTKEFICHPPHKYEDFMDKYKIFDNIINELYNLNLSNDTLINHNLLELGDKYLISMCDTQFSEYMQARYPYYSELAVLNAKEALRIFKNHFNQNIQYYILNGGLSRVIDRLEKIIKKNKGTIKLNTYVEDIKEVEDTFVVNNKFKCNNLILALPKVALVKLNYLKPIKKLLNSVSEQPLYRIYMKYPIKNKVAWFEGCPKCATNLQIKFFIPYNYKTGLIMISYTDGKYAKFWINKLLKGEEEFQKEMKSQLQKMFPDKDIPDPIWTKHHYWDTGANYWKKGYDRDHLMNKIIKPNKSRLYICGESYSSQQAWIEGALETSNIVINKF